MYVLGINFGHDASFSLFLDGKLENFVELERRSRLKHQVGITGAEIKGFVHECGITLQQVDLVAITATQYYTARFDDEIKLTPTDKVDIENAQYTSGWYDYGEHKFRLKNQSEQVLPDTVFDKRFLENDIVHGLETARSLLSRKESEIKNAFKESLKVFTIIINDVSLQAFFVQHQWAHAGYASYYYANTSNLIVSHDGGWPHIPFNSSGVFINSNGFPFPIFDPKLYIGQLYQLAGEWAGFRPAEAPGKLMGLASYGVPSEEVWDVLNYMRENENHAVSTSTEFAKFLEKLKVKILKLAGGQIRQSQFKDFPIKNHQSIHIASNVQRVVELKWLQFVEQLSVRLSEVSQLSSDMLIVGGFSLNCPANSIAHTKSGQFNPIVFPGGGDMGISIGAAHIVSVLCNPKPSVDNLGRVVTAFETKYSTFNIQKAKSELELVCDEVTPKKVAELIIDGAIMCRASGGPEIGPRALGNRSILAHAVQENIRDKINKRKGREDWRPLAPIVRYEDYHNYFSGDPDRCGFMLTAEFVKNTRIPAVTHIDNTSRVQVVRSGFIWNVLSEIKNFGEDPVIINTSFNVAGEPLVDDSTGIINSFKKLNFDYLIFDTALFSIRKH